MLGLVAMVVKASQSAARVLAVLEKVAELQPVGISELARRLEADTSAVQRALVTLAQENWIRAIPGKPTRWEMSERIHTVAHVARGHNELRERARPMLRALRDETGESVFLNIPDHGRFVVCDVLESRQYLRVVLAVGMIFAARGSATGRALLPYMSRAQQIEYLGTPPDAPLIREFKASVARGYSVSRGELVPESTNLAAPVFEAGGEPVAAVLVSAPTDRLVPELYARIGAMVAGTARQLSRAPAPAVRFD